MLRRPETSATGKAIDKREKAITNKKSHRFRSSKPMAFYIIYHRFATVRVRRPIGFRTPPNQIPYAVQSDSVRRPIGFRTPSNRIPFAARPLVAYSFGTLYEAVDDNIKQNERQYIYRNNISNGHVLVKHYVQHNESQLQAENRGKSTMLG